MVQSRKLVIQGSYILVMVVLAGVLGGIGVWIADRALDIPKGAPRAIVAQKRGEGAGPVLGFLAIFGLAAGFLATGPVWAKLAPYLGVSDDEIQAIVGPTSKAPDA